MKKSYKIILLLAIFLLLTTYTPSEISIFKSEKNHLFKIKNIEIVNNQLVSDLEVSDKLQNIYGKNIFLIKKDDFSKQLKSINFLQKVEIKKKYPNKIIIKIYETRPIAMLFIKNKKYILDSSSNLITFNENIKTDSLPSVFGDGAEHNFVNFFNKLKKNNFPQEKIKNYYYFQIERWDIQLLNSRVIKFPPNKLKSAIQKSIKLLERQDFQNYNIIDLRIHGKIVVE